jgi:hypothetical protein
MKSFLAIVSGLLLCSCADMYVTNSQVTTAGGHSMGAVDAKDVGVHMITNNCGVGEAHPSAIYIRPFCIDTASFSGDEGASDGEMPIRKALTPVEFAEDMKEELEKMAPTRILRDGETPRVGWLIEGQFRAVDGGDPYERFFLGTFGVGRSYLQLHVRVTDVEKHMVIYEFDMAGGSRDQGRRGTLRSSGLGKASHFDLRNAAERIYVTLSANPFRYGERADHLLHE